MRLKMQTRYSCPPIDFFDAPAGHERGLVRDASSIAIPQGPAKDRRPSLEQRRGVIACSDLRLTEALRPFTGLGAERARRLLAGAWPNRCDRIAFLAVGALYCDRPGEPGAFAGQYPAS